MRLARTGRHGVAEVDLIRNHRVMTILRDIGVTERQGLFDTLKVTSFCCCELQVMS